MPHQEQEQEQSGGTKRRPQPKTPHAVTFGIVAPAKPAKKHTVAATAKDAAKAFEKAAEKARKAAATAEAENTSMFPAARSMRARGANIKARVAPAPATARVAPATARAQVVGLRFGFEKALNEVDDFMTKPYLFKMDKVPESLNVIEQNIAEAMKDLAAYADRVAQFRAKYDAKIAPANDLAAMIAKL